MSEANQVNNPDASAIVPLKHRRGRPRKYPKMEGEGLEHEQRKQSQRKEQPEGKQTKRGTERASSNTPSSSASFQTAPGNLLLFHSLSLYYTVRR